MVKVKILISLKCNNCDHTATTKANLNKHILRQHTTLEEKLKSKFYCKVCDVPFFCKFDCNKHLIGKAHLNREKLKIYLEK